MAGTLRSPIQITRQLLANNATAPEAVKYYIATLKSVGYDEQTIAECEKCYEAAVDRLMEQPAQKNPAQMAVHIKEQQKRLMEMSRQPKTPSK